MAAPALTLPILTRWLSPADYGIVALGQVVGLLFMGLTDLGVSRAVERNFFEYEGTTRSSALLHTGVGLVAASMVVWCAIFWILRHRMAWVLTGSTQWASLIWVMSLSAALGLVVTMHLIYLRNAGHAVQYAIFCGGGAVLESVLAVGLVVGGGWGVWGLVAGQLIAKCVVVGTLWGCLARALPPRFDLAVARALLGIGLPLTPRTIVSVADKAVDRLLLGWLRSLGQVGVFGLASAIGYSIFSLLTSLEHVYIPQVYRRMFEGGRDAGREIGRYLTPYAYASLFVPLMVVLFIDEISWILVGPAFSEIKYLVPLLAAYYGQMFFSKICGAQFVFSKKLWYTTPLALLGLGLHLGLGFLLVPRYGALGAALGILGTGIVVDAIGFRVGQRQYPIRYEASVIPMLGLLYVSVAWVMLPRFIGLPYAATLAGKLVLLGGFVGGGLRWLPTALAAFTPFVRGQQGNVAPAKLS